MESLSQSFEITSPQYLEQENNSLAIEMQNLMLKQENNRLRENLEELFFQDASKKKLNQLIIDSFYFLKLKDLQEIKYYIKNQIEGMSRNKNKSKLDVFLEKELENFFLNFKNVESKNSSITKNNKESQDYSKYLQQSEYRSNQDKICLDSDLQLKSSTLLLQSLSENSYEQDIQNCIKELQKNMIKKSNQKNIIDLRNSSQFKTSIIQNKKTNYTEVKPVLIFKNEKKIHRQIQQYKQIFKSQNPTLDTLNQNILTSRENLKSIHSKNKLQSFHILSKYSQLKNPSNDQINVEKLVLQMGNQINSFKQQLQSQRNCSTSKISQKKLQIEKTIQFVQTNRESKVFEGKELFGQIKLNDLKKRHKQKVKKRKTDRQSKPLQSLKISFTSNIGQTEDMFIQPKKLKDKTQFRKKKKQVSLKIELGGKNTKRKLNINDVQQPSSSFRTLYYTTRNKSQLKRQNSLFNKENINYTQVVNHYRNLSPLYNSFRRLTNLDTMKRQKMKNLKINQSNKYYQNFYIEVQLLQIF